MARWRPTRIASAQSANCWSSRGERTQQVLLWRDVLIPAIASNGVQSRRWMPLSMDIMPFCTGLRDLAPAQGQSRVRSTNSRPVRWMDGGNTKWSGVQALFWTGIASRYPAYALDSPSPLHIRRTESSERANFILDGRPRLSRRVGF